MWSQLALCLFVGLTYASTNPAWKDNTEYVYSVNGYTVSSLHEAAEVYSGVYLKANLNLIIRSDGKLQGRITDPKYAQLEGRLPNGWHADVDDLLSYKPLALTQKSFQLNVEDGLIKSLIVEKDVTNWEANIIRSIVSQFQLDLQGKKVIDSPINQLPTNDKLDGVFKTMEETVTGETETLYEIHPISEYLLQTISWIAPKYQYKQNNLVEITKFKNYTNAEQRPCYHYGFAGIDESEPSSNKMGQFFIRESTSGLVLSGQLSDYDIQSSWTVSKIYVNPIFKTQQMGSVVSMLNVTLLEINSQQQPEDLVNPIDIGSLVYSYAEAEEPVSNVQRSTKRTHEMLRRSSKKLRKMHTSMNGKLDNIKEAVKSLVEGIDQDIRQPEQILSEVTLNKYTILAQSVMLMTKDEIQSVAEEVNQQDSQQWAIYRDAVADAGTFPAFLTIKDWIETRKIQNTEAAFVLWAAAKSTRYPTVDYIKSFFELVQSSNVIQQEYLNETSLLSFTNLLHQVYVDSRESHNQFPVHTYGDFNTEEGREYLETIVIPYLTQQLEDAISRADAPKIHSYIRALGNIATRSVLNVFEPYLEGKKQVSQFQRLWMVTSLERLIYTDVAVAQSVFYKIYRNVAEIPEIRVIAVYHLIKTQPAVEILQRMAEFTNYDVEEQVNAAVSSILKSAIKMEGEKYQQLRQFAQSAVPLLNKKQYGTDQSFLHLQQYVIEQFRNEYDHSFIEIGSEDYDLPKYLGWDILENDHGVDSRYIKVRSFISSIKDLVNVFYRQTAEYKMSQNQRARQEETTWSSANIAKLLNYKQEEREQLEAVIFTEINYLQKLWSIDNQTLEQLPELIRQKEQILADGHQFNYTKLSNAKQAQLSFPTEMGFPFFYEYDMPVLVQFQGKIRATATPQISRNQRLNKPDQIVAEIESELTLSTQSHGHIAFWTPFDQQFYMAGYDRNAQIHLPIKSEIEIDLKSKSIKFVLEFQESHQNTRMIHFSTVPYVARSDIVSFKPFTMRSNVYLIDSQQNQHRHFDVTFGKSETGFAFRAWGHHPSQTVSLKDFTLWKLEGICTSLEKIWDKLALTSTEFNLRFVPQESVSQKLSLNIKYDQQYNKQPNEQTEQDFLDVNQLETKIESTDRFEQIVKHVSSGIQSCKWTIVDVTLDNEKFQWVFGGAAVKSNANPASRVLVYYKNQETLFAAEAKAKVPNTNGLNVQTSLDTKPSAQYDARVQYVKNGKVSKISTEAQLTRSEARKQALIKTDLYKLCVQQMQQQNYQLSACQNVTISANYLDDIAFDVKYDNISPRVSRVVSGVFQAATIFYFPMVEVTDAASSDSEGAIKGRIQFQPEDLRQVNVTVQTDNAQYKFINISYDDDIRTIIVPHPVFHLRSRMSGLVQGQYSFRPTCVIDQTVAQTFTNKTYEISMDQQYTVAMQYIPREARLNEATRRTVVEQLESQLENYIVLIRQIAQNEREVVLTFNHPKTQDESVEIKMTYQQGVSQVYVNNEKVTFNDQQIADLYNGFVQIYTLPNSGETKIEIENAFYLIFDGARVKITATNGKLRDSVMGLCGRFSQDQYEDFTTPQNCVIKSQQQFMETYQVQQGQRRRQFRDNECIEKVQPLYADVISERDSGKNQQQKRKSGMELRTRYVEQDNEICFTLQPMPVCDRRPRMTVNKMVPVHCVVGTKLAYYMKSQIDQGANPDFSHKMETKTVRMELPVQC